MGCGMVTAKTKGASRKTIFHPQSLVAHHPVETENSCLQSFRLLHHLCLQKCSPLLEYLLAWVWRQNKYLLYFIKLIFDIIETRDWVKYNILGKEENRVGNIKVQKGIKNTSLLP